MNDDDILKDFTVPTPRVKTGRMTKDGEPESRPRSWTLAEVEDACWSARTAGATDETKVDGIESGYGSRPGGLKFKSIPAFVVEILPAQRRHATLYEPEPEPVPVKVRRPIRPDQVVIIVTEVVAAAILIPMTIWLVVFVWTHTVGGLV